MTSRTRRNQEVKEAYKLCPQRTTVRSGPAKRFLSKQILGSVCLHVVEAKVVFWPNYLWDSTPSTSENFKRKVHLPSWGTKDPTKWLGNTNCETFWYCLALWRHLQAALAFAGGCCRRKCYWKPSSFERCESETIEGQETNLLLSILTQMTWFWMQPRTSSPTSLSRITKLFLSSSVIHLGSKSHGSIFGCPKTHTHTHTLTFFILLNILCLLRWGPGWNSGTAYIFDVMSIMPWWPSHSLSDISSSGGSKIFFLQWTETQNRGVNVILIQAQVLRFSIWLTENLHLQLWFLEKLSKKEICHTCVNFHCFPKTAWLLPLGMIFDQMNAAKSNTVTLPRKLLPGCKGSTSPQSQWCLSLTSIDFVANCDFFLTPWGLARSVFAFSCSRWEVLLGSSSAACFDERNVTSCREPPTSVTDTAN